MNNIKHILILLLVALFIGLFALNANSTATPSSLSESEKLALIDDFIDAAFSDEIWYFIPEYQDKPFKYEAGNPEHEALRKEYNLPESNRLVRWEKSNIDIGFYYPSSEENTITVYPKDPEKLKEMVRNNVSFEIVSPETQGENISIQYIEDNTNTLQRFSKNMSREVSFTSEWNNLFVDDFNSQMSLQTPSDIVLHPTRSSEWLLLNKVIPLPESAQVSRAVYLAHIGGIWINNDYEIVKGITCGEISKCLGLINLDTTSIVNTEVKQSQMLQILYNSNLRTGMSKAEVRKIVQDNINFFIKENTKRFSFH